MSDNVVLLKAEIAALGSELEVQAAEAREARAKLAAAMGALEQAAQVLSQVHCVGGVGEKGGPLHCIGCLSSATAKEIRGAVADEPSTSKRLRAIEKAAERLEYGLRGDHRLAIQEGFALLEVTMINIRHVCEAVRKKASQ